MKYGVGFLQNLSKRLKKDKGKTERFGEDCALLNSAGAQAFPARPIFFPQMELRRKYL
jgi:hypothetical protein